MQPRLLQHTDRLPSRQLSLCKAAAARPNCVATNATDLTRRMLAHTTKRNERITPTASRPRSLIFTLARACAWPSVPSTPTAHTFSMHALTSNLSLFLCSRPLRDSSSPAWRHVGRKPKDMGSDGGNVVVTSARVVRQPGDGSCLFHSLSYGLADGTSASQVIPQCLSPPAPAPLPPPPPPPPSLPCDGVLQLRRELASFVLKHPDLEIADDPLKDWVAWDSEGGRFILRVPCATPSRSPSASVSASTAARWPAAVFGAAALKWLR